MLWYVNSATTHQCGSILRARFQTNPNKRPKLTPFKRILVSSRMYRHTTIVDDFQRFSIDASCIGRQSGYLRLIVDSSSFVLCLGHSNRAARYNGMNVCSEETRRWPHYCRRPLLLESALKRLLRFLRWHYCTRSTTLCARFMEICRFLCLSYNIVIESVANIVFRSLISDMNTWFVRYLRIWVI